MMRRMKGAVVMLNLLRFREVADYSATPDLAPEGAISGAAAFHKYIEHTLPYLRQSGGDVLFLASGDHFLIGPESERWDMVMLGAAGEHRCVSYVRILGAPNCGP